MKERTYTANHKGYEIEVKAKGYALETTIKQGNEIKLHEFHTNTHISELTWARKMIDTNQI